MILALLPLGCTEARLSFAGFGSRFPTSLNAMTTGRSLTRHERLTGVCKTGGVGWTSPVMVTSSAGSRAAHRGYAPVWIVGQPPRALQGFKQHVRLPHRRPLLKGSRELPVTSAALPVLCEPLAKIITFGADGYWLLSSC
jgi:hypothetical protein